MSAPWFALPSGAQLSRCLSKDPARPSLQDAHLVKDGSAWKLLATDSYVMAVVSVEVVVPKGGKQPKPLPIPAEALQRAEKHGGLIFHGDSWEPCSRQGAGIGIRWRCGEPHEKAASLLDVFHSSQHRKDVSTFTVALGADLLLRMAQAEGAPLKQVRLTLDPSKPLHPIEITAAKSEVQGLLMPVRIEDQ